MCFMKTRIRLKLTTFFLAIIIAILLSPNYINAQANRKIPTNSQTTQAKWIVFSPPDKGFTVELPSNPEHSNTLDPNDPGDDKDLFKCSKSLNSYTLLVDSETSKLDKFTNRIIIGSFDVSGCQRSNPSFIKETKILSEFLGGDNKTTIENSKVYVSGLPARNLVFYNEGYGRILMINAKRRIFMLIYFTNKDNPSEVAERIFRTFRPKSIR